MTRALLIALFVLPAAACASAQATAPATPVALEVPPVPPRVIAPIPPAEPPEIEPVQPLEPEQLPPPAQRRPSPRPPAQPATAPEAKPETPPEVAPPPSATPTVPPLRTPGAGDGPDAERQVREIVARAGGTLRSVDYANLSPARRLDYDSAKNFIKQAEDNLKANNPVLARSLAERAERLANLLIGK